MARAPKIFWARHCSRVDASCGKKLGGDRPQIAVREDPATRPWWMPRGRPSDPRAHGTSAPICENRRGSLGSACAKAKILSDSAFQRLNAQLSSMWISFFFIWWWKSGSAAPALPPQLHLVLVPDSCGTNTFHLDSRSEHDTSDWLQGEQAINGLMWDLKQRIELMFH